MPDSAGLFDGFGDLNQIQAANVAKWLNPVPHITSLEDYIANRQIFPHAVPISLFEAKVDLAIFRELLILDKEAKTKFLDTTTRKVLIPARLIQYVPDLTSLVLAFIDALLLNYPKKDFFDDLWTVTLSGEIADIVGSVIVPQFQTAGGFIEVKSGKKSLKIRVGGLGLLPCLKDRCKIEYKVSGGTVLNKSEDAIEVYGGKFGVLIDGRTMNANH